jgi:predicted transcriptional regulator
MPMKNVTITLEDEVAKWARMQAAAMDTSVSRMLGEILKERMAREERYLSAQRRFMSRRAMRLREKNRSLPGRDELYER